MKWYVIDYDFDTGEPYSYNIFESTRFKQEINKLLDEFITFDDFIEKLNKLSEDCFTKTTYNQVVLNLEILAEYIIREHNKKVTQNWFKGPLFEKSGMAGLAEMIKECGENDDTREA